MKKWHKRLLRLVIILTCITAALIVIIRTFNENITLFATPTDVVSGTVTGNFRLGGMVKAGSMHYEAETRELSFIITDFVHEIPARYKGIVPSLFKEESGTVAKGALHGRVFYVEELLAKHDENYMPKEVAEALKKSGKWRQDSLLNEKDASR